MVGCDQGLLWLISVVGLAEQFVDRSQDALGFVLQIGEQFRRILHAIFSAGFLNAFGCFLKLFGAEQSAGSFQCVCVPTCFIVQARGNFIAELIHQLSALGSKYKCQSQDASRSAWNA